MDKLSPPSWYDRMRAWSEAVIMTRMVSADKPGPVFRLLFRIPIFLFRYRLEAFNPPGVLLLTTTGRKSGQPHATPLEYVKDEETGVYRVSAGWGGKTDWYRNAKANPVVSVQVGRTVFQACAVPSPDEEIGKQMYAVSRRLPVMDRVWQRWSDRPIDGTLESYVYAARFFPSLRLVPLEGQGTNGELKPPSAQGMK